MGSGPSKGKHHADGSSLDDETSPRTKSSENGEPSAVFQAGGHGRLSKDPVHEGAIRKFANEAEIQFYQTLNSEDTHLVTIPDHIRSFFPKFYGVSEKKFVVLQDLTHNVKKACVMDVKMGTKTYTDDSNVIKKWMLENKDSKTTTSTLGFRVTGFRTYRQPAAEYDVKGRPWGMALTPDDIVENLSTFFFDGVRTRSDVLDKYINRLEVLLPWYSEQNIIKLFSSSLLFVYDSDGDADMAEVHMIDFAHVKRTESPDDRDYGYIAGLKNLINIFKHIRALKGSTEDDDDGSGLKSSSQDISTIPKIELLTDGEKKKKHKSKDSSPTTEANANAEGESPPMKTPKKRHHAQNSSQDSGENTAGENDTKLATGEGDKKKKRKSLSKSAPAVTEYHAGAEGEAPLPKTPKKRSNPNRASQDSVETPEENVDVKTTPPEGEKKKKRRKSVSKDMLTPADAGNTDADGVEGEAVPRPKSPKKRSNRSSQDQVENVAEEEDTKQAKPKSARKAKTPREPQENGIDAN